MSDISDTTAPVLSAQGALFGDDSLLPMQNAAHGLRIDELDIIVIDPSRTMQTVLRSILQHLRPKRLRVRDSAVAALRDMVVEPPNLVLCEWKMDAMSGHSLIKIMRHKSMAPLCFVPIIVITGSATRSTVETALRTGAHAVLVKPLSPAVLRKRLDWLGRDDRLMVAEGDHFVIEGVSAALDQQRAKDRLPAIIQQFRLAEHAKALARDGSAHSFKEDAPAGPVDKDLLMAGLEQPNARNAKRSQPSPTLNRLLRQRAAGEHNEERARAARQVSREKIELASSKRKRSGQGLSPWKELWNS